MAQRLLERSFEVGFVARRPAVVAEFIAIGGTHYASVRDLAKRSDVVLVVVVDDAQLRDVAVTQGLIEDLPPGAVIVVHSTVHPDTCRQLAALAAERGIDLIDAPVTGGPQRTRDGELTMPVGCDDPAALERVRPILDVLATTVARVGPVGAGEAVKLLNNFFYTAHLVTALDTELLIDRLGLDRENVARILPTCSGSSDVLRQRATAPIVFRPFDHVKGLDFANGVLHKDVGLFLEIAQASGIDMATEFADSLRLVEASLERGHPLGTPNTQVGVEH
jgi:3-hydroxyisobutyrate dehydrogenase